ncbi:hypothetical protein TrLO_g13946 [Triparma laevis f. longispina]|uniref:Uncharacterized protein n=1 Tax=Triparma laevis f. longispina TaxID=1714387 RepID=A0A9W7CEN8_9STRA|nr:hypothetical protein TrLO_g13946 [Triparma laevis f. longispina]
MDFPFSETSQFYLPHPNSDLQAVSLVIKIPDSCLDWFNTSPSDPEESSKYSTIVKIVNEVIIPRHELSNRPSSSTSPPTTTCNSNPSSNKKNQPPNIVPTSDFESERDPNNNDMLLEYSTNKMKTYGLVNGLEVLLEVMILVQREISE